LVGRGEKKTFAVTMSVRIIAQLTEVQPNMCHVIVFIIHVLAFVHI
jgi:hypothetical protein